jgi:hypothetical protein
VYEAISYRLPRIVCGSPPIPSFVAVANIEKIGRKADFFSSLLEVARCTGRRSREPAEPSCDRRKTSWRFWFILFHGGFHKQCTHPY